MSVFDKIKFFTEKSKETKNERTNSILISPKHKSSFIQNQNKQPSTSFKVENKSPTQEIKTNEQETIEKAPEKIKTIKIEELNSKSESSLQIVKDEAKELNIEQNLSKKYSVPHHIKSINVEKRKIVEISDVEEDNMFDEEIHVEILDEIISEIIQEDKNMTPKFIPETKKIPIQKTLTEKSQTSPLEQKVSKPSTQLTITVETVESQEEKSPKSPSDSNVELEKPTIPMKRRDSKLNERIMKMENIIQKTRSHSTIISNPNERKSITKPLPKPVVQLDEKTPIIEVVPPEQPKVKDERELVNNSVLEGIKAVKKITQPLETPKKEESPKVKVSETGDTKKSNEKHVITTTEQIPSLTTRISSLFSFASDSDASPRDLITKRRRQPKTPTSKSVENSIDPKNRILLEQKKFDEIFENKVLKNYFKKYLEKDFNENCLKFSDEVDNFRAIQKQKENVFDEAISILRRFIVPKSIEEIPIDKNERSLVFLQFKDLESMEVEHKITPEIFDKAQEKAKLFLKMNHFDNFLTSPDFIQYLFNEENVLYLDGALYDKNRYQSYFDESGITLNDLKDEKILKEM
jgi:hypothetical protein